MYASAPMKSMAHQPILALDEERSFLLLTVKRCMDILFSVFFLAVLSPLLFFLGCLVKFTSHGSVFYGDYRVGQNGRLFKMYKFRTMYNNADQLKQQLMHQNEMSGPAFKMKKDPRVTPLGRFLRKHSLDELPQLWSILKGDMSLVGPRPPLPSEVEQYEPWHRRRLCIKPGATCLWQVMGRNEIDNFDDWVRIDLIYIQNWSLWLDCKIVLKTIWAVVKGTGC